jgi:hypothetical protein
VLSRIIKREARKRITRPARAALRGLAERWCPECQKRVQPFHLCAPRSDFKARRTRYERAQTRRKRGGTRPPRERREHDYHACRDEDCPRGLCRAFREGIQACPLPHQG